MKLSTPILIAGITVWAAIVVCHAESTTNPPPLKAAPLGEAWMAPANGYVPSFQDSGQVKGYQGGEIGERRFYLQLQNGNEYGHMTIDLYAPYNFGISGMVRLSYAVNPSGSRILR